MFIKNFGDNPRSYLSVAKYPVQAWRFRVPTLTMGKSWKCLNLKRVPNPSRNLR